MAARAVSLARGAADAQEKRTADRRLFDAIGAFLSRHALEPSPANYLLAHKLITRTDPAAIAAVEAATSDGVRLSQRDADRILGEAGITLGGGGQSGTEAALQEAGRQLALIETIVGATQAHAERYGRDLEFTASQLRQLPAADPLEHLLRITATMIARTREAEIELHNTTVEVQSLRTELASISEEARTDPLTGLANRRALEDHYARLQSCGVTFCVAICDIDRFKSINDRHGHAVGDRVLKAVAAVLAGNSPGQMVARYGGEEFVLLLSGMRLAAAASQVDAARAELAGRRFRIRETDEEVGSVTFSAGVVEAEARQTWVEAISRADEMLYRAKNAGRNRTELAQSPAKAGRGIC